MRTNKLKRKKQIIPIETYNANHFAELFLLNFLNWN